MKKLLAVFAILAASVTSAQAGVYKICQVYGSYENVTIFDEGNKFSVLDADLNPIFSSPILDKEIRKNVFIGEREEMVFMRTPVEYSVKDDRERKAFSFTGCKTIKEEAKAPTTAQANDVTDHGSEFAERGDIARPEFKGANTFIGDAYNNEGTFSGKVRLERAANGDITLTFIDENESKIYALNPDMDGKPSTYEEPRLSTDFYIAKDIYYSVTNTKIVK
ncbi:hypothetical protein D7B12_18155 [Salmonella enterica]|nr:hypothetical protein [Salmonella enterica]